MLTREQIAWTAAQDLWTGAYVNLGIGMPTLIARYLRPDCEVILHSENGMLGFESGLNRDHSDEDIVDAGETRVSIAPGGSFFDHNLAFQMIQGGHLDLSILGCFEVSMRGDLASWSLGDTNTPPAVGGAMDLAVGSKSVWVLTQHKTRAGKLALVDDCRLPLTGKACVHRIYTDLGVFEICDKGFKLMKVAPGLSPREIENALGLSVQVAEDLAELTVPE